MTGADHPATAAAAALGIEPVEAVETPIRLEYRYTPGRAQSRFLRAIERGELRGRRCASCGKVYMPPRGSCSMCGSPYTDEEVEVADTGTVSTFAVVNVNFASRQVDLPYICAEVRFDGADITTQLLLHDCAPEDARMGMRVRAVWRPEDELGPTLGNIEHVIPLDEPDAPLETYEGFI